MDMNCQKKEYVSWELEQQKYEVWKYRERNGMKKQKQSLKEMWEILSVSIYT